MSAIAHAKQVFDSGRPSLELDVPSANAILTVAGSMPPHQRRVLDAMPVSTAAVVAWKLIK